MKMHVLKLQLKSKNFAFVKFIVLMPLSVWILGFAQ